MLAADDARATKVRKNVGWNTAEGVLCWLESISAVITVEGGKVDTLEENEGRFAEAWVTCRRVLACFVICFWHSEVWTLRNEELERIV